VTVTTVPTVTLRAAAMERFRIELKSFFRNRAAAFFTFLLPIMMLLIFGSLFNFKLSGPPGTEPISSHRYLSAGLLASVVLSTAFSGLAISVASEQHDGLLKRLAGTPLPRAAYLIGKLATITVLTALTLVVMFAIGIAFFDLALPSTAKQWAVLAAVLSGGLIASALMGLAMTRFIPNSRSAAAIVQPPYLFLFMTSGIFFSVADMPNWMRIATSLFPLKWMAQGMRFALLPEWFASQEPAKSWELGWVVGMVGLWVVVGAVLCRWWFRWDRRTDS